MGRCKSRMWMPLYGLVESESWYGGAHVSNQRHYLVWWGEIQSRQSRWISELLDKHSSSPALPFSPPEWQCFGYSLDARTALRKVKIVFLHITFDAQKNCDILRQVLIPFGSDWTTTSTTFTTIMHLSISLAVQNSFSLDMNMEYLYRPAGIRDLHPIENQ